jgi:hypothetical protein
VLSAVLYSSNYISIPLTEEAGQVIVAYIVFCVGCGMIQNAGAKMPDPHRPGASALAVPPLFLNRTVINIVGLLGLVAFVAEIWMGFKIVRWWSIGVCILAFAIAFFVFRGNNPAPPFFLGIFVSMIGVGMLLLAG